ANAVTLGVASSIAPSFARCRVQAANAALLGAASPHPCRLLSPERKPPMRSRSAQLPPPALTCRPVPIASRQRGRARRSFLRLLFAQPGARPPWFRSADPLCQSAHLQGANAFDICCANALASARARVFVPECANALAPPCACSPAPGFAIAPPLDPQHSMTNTSAFNCVNAASSAAPMRPMFAAPTCLLRTAPMRLPPAYQGYHFWLRQHTALDGQCNFGTGAYTRRSLRKLARFMIQARCIRHLPPGAPVLTTLPYVLDSGAPPCSFLPRRRRHA
ncbi:hypothetical protein PUNSTDRAFT_135087, partial [Punctularia strigosozonata HHB-11173 SS5]|uniref:uncharacterized protein n=1 Tax=Punctularia strigosozonata (strain HHB-11173) TaxID=741275 RepID=UPI00044171D6